jgi:hypothetical protein
MGPKKLHVSGEVFNTGAKVATSLTPKVPPGINPTIYVLELHIKPEDQAEGSSTASVKYEEAVDPLKWKAVEIHYQQKKIAFIDEIKVVS